MEDNLCNVIWLDEAPHLGQKLVHIRRSVQTLFKDGDKNDCSHSEDHCWSIENSFHRLIPKDRYKLLSVNERFFLLASPWILNIAWNQPLDNSMARPTDEWYHLKSIQFLGEETITLLLDLNAEEVAIFKHIIMYHSFARDLEQCPPELNLGPNTVRVRLLTAYLRLADAAHVDETEGPTSLFYFLDNPDSPELFHWIKSRLQPSIRLEPNLNTIELYVNKQTEASDNLIDKLKNEMTLHIDSAKNTLVRGNITSYLTVNVDLMQGPPILPQKRTELAKLMREFDLSFPPNASALQSLYLSSVQELSKKSTNTDALLQEIAQLQGIAKQVKNLRRCHIGLERYMKECDAILKRDEDASKTLRNLALWAERSQRERTERLSRVCEHAGHELLKHDTFLLFGFSTTIINSFQKLSNLINGESKSSMSIYICEAHNKARIDASKRLTYIDGINYAEQVKDAFPKAIIKLIPDVTVADVFKLNEGRKWAMLFGANGVTREAACGHSAGHLTLAIVAKHFNTPVYTLCDSYKIGDLMSVDSTAEREDQWLKCVPTWRRPQHEDFDLYNVRENIVDSDLITAFITEDGVFSPADFKTKYSSEVTV